MPRKRNPKNDNCTKHNIELCSESRYVVKIVQAKIEMIHESNISQAINQIIEEYAQFKKIEI